MVGENYSSIELLGAPPPKLKRWLRPDAFLPPDLRVLDSEIRLASSEVVGAN